MKYIDADRLRAEIEKTYKSEIQPWLSGVSATSAIYDYVLPLIDSLQQSAIEEERKREQEYREFYASYGKYVNNTIDKKRALPTFKGRLLHDFKNELHTMKQIVDLTNHPEINEGLFDKLALVFATWGGYHFHPNDSPTENSLQQDQPEVDLEKFTEKMNAWKARYNYPDNIPIKAAMAFTARMFYQYPNVARQWYDSLPKVTMD